MCPVDVSSLLGNFKVKLDVNLITDFNATFASLSGYKLTFNDLICELSFKLSCNVSFKPLCKLSCKLVF